MATNLSAKYAVEASARPTLRWLILIAIGAILFTGSVVVGKKIEAGDNYQIYQYISTYKNINGVYPNQTDGIAHKIDPKYRDYTPVNSLIYRAIFSLPAGIQQPAYCLYEVFVLLSGLICLYSLCRSGVVPREMYNYSILFFLFNPLVYRVLGADDKAGFFTAPLLCLYFAEQNEFAGAIAVGIFAGWLGLGAASIPVLPNLAKGRLHLAAGLVAIALLIMVVMLFGEGRDALTALQNRAARESMAPFAVSIWRWLPGWPVARYPVLLLFLGIFGVLAWTRRLKFIAALPATASAYLLFSNNTVAPRILFFVPILALCFETRGMRRYYLLFSFVALILGHGLRRFTPGFNPDATLGVALCNAVLIIPLVNALMLGFRRGPMPNAADAAVGVAE